MYMYMSYDVIKINILCSPSDILVTITEPQDFTCS